MTELTLPYTLQDGQRAYAARVMANLTAIVDKLNRVSLPGLPDCDMEEALLQLKLLLDQEYAADAKLVRDFSYDSHSNRLSITLADGALFQVDMGPFFNDYLGLNRNGLQVVVDGQRRISAAVNPHAISYDMLSQALQAAIDGAVAANSPGNAGQILFADGDSFQHKLDSGQLQGPAGVAVAISGLFYLRVGDDGHLYAGVAEGADPPPLSINEQGRLIYTIA